MVPPGANTFSTTPNIDGINDLILFEQAFESTPRGPSSDARLLDTNNILLLNQTRNGGELLWCILRRNQKFRVSLESLMIHLKSCVDRVDQGLHLPRQEKDNSSLMRMISQNVRSGKVMHPQQSSLIF